MHLKTTVAGALLLAAISATSAAQAPPLIPIQGYLEGNADDPVDGLFPMAFRLYTVASGGSPIYVESATVAIEEGRFTTYLGELTPLNLSLLDGGGPLYLGVQVVGSPELSPRIELGSVAFAAFAEYAGNVPWAGISDVPAYLADGDQDTTYTAALPLVLSGSSFTLSSSGCSVGEAWMWTAGGWDCRSVDTAGLQTRVAQSCDPGSSIRQINSDGTVSCEDDNIGGGIQSVTAGAGLTGGGTASSITMAVDFGDTQARVDGTCDAGLFMRGIGADGTPACAAPAAPTTIGPGFGIVLATATTLAIDQGVVQRVLTANCPANEYLYGISASGTPACRPDTDTNTTYAGGDGITVASGVISANTAFLQRRVNGAVPCAFGIANISDTGLVTCAANSDTNTTYGSGFGISLVAGNFEVNTTQVQRRVATGSGANALPCAYGIANIAQDGVVTCATNNDTNSTYSNGFGLSLSGGQFAVDATVIQRRVNGALPCAFGIANIDQAGTVTCAGNNDTNTWPPGFSSGCPDTNHYMYGRDGNGYALCRHMRDYINSSCAMWVGWSDSERPCCEALGHGTSTGGIIGGYNGNGGEVRRHWWGDNLLQGINYGGDVNGDDTLYIAFRCY